MTTTNLMQRIGMALGVLLVPLAAQAAPSTYAQTETRAAVGADGANDQDTQGPLIGGTRAESSASWPLAGTGSSASSSMQASAEYGALRAHGTVRASGPNASGTIGSEFAGDPLTAALFEDQILIGGTGTQTFQLHYALTGSAGSFGPGQMQFAADLTLQAWGTGITITEAPTPVGFSFFPPYIDTYGLSVSGSSPRAFGDNAFLVISANAGSVLNLSGALGAYLRLTNPIDGGESEATLDLSHTAAYYIVPVTSDTTFVAASGHDYLSTPVPEVGTATLMLAALPLVGWAHVRRRQRQGTNASDVTHRASHLTS